MLPAIVIELIPGKDGDRLSREEQGSPEMRARMLAIAAALRQARVVQGSPYWRNFVKPKDGTAADVVMIDFGRAILDASDEELDDQDRRLEDLVATAAASLAKAPAEAPAEAPVEAPAEATAGKRKREAEGTEPAARKAQGAARKA